VDSYTVFPDKRIENKGIVSQTFIRLGIKTFWGACDYVHALPYGYNSNREDVLILFKEGFGSCSTKHAVIATLAEELGIPIVKIIGIYAMNEELVAGTQAIIDTYQLPFVPMHHCFLAYESFRVDLTEGNNNGKNRSIEDFLFIEKAMPNISEKDEYLLYRNALKDQILMFEPLKGIDLNRILHARTEAIALLRSKVSIPVK